MVIKDTQWRRSWIGILGVVAVLCSSKAGDVVPPSVPDNAALLYYQASLKGTQLHMSEGLSAQITRVAMHGYDPDDQIRDFLNQSDCQEVIFLTRRATEMSQCNWGLVFSARWTSDARGLLLFLSELLSARARLLALNGQPRQAIEGALELRRFAQHIGDDTFIMWYTSNGVDAVAFLTIQYVLGKMPLAADALTWLKEQVEREQRAQWQPRRTLQKWRDTRVWEWQTYSNRYTDWKSLLPQMVEDEDLRKKLEGLTQAQVVELVRIESAAFLKSFLEILENDGPFQEKYSQLRRLREEANSPGNEGDPYAILGSDAMFEKYYSAHTHAMTRQNAVMAAVEIYLICARTGQLPQVLPAGLPGDPYSGKDFEYKITENGFTLRCRAKAIDFADIRQFDFRVAK